MIFSEEFGAKSVTLNAAPLPTPTPTPAPTPKPTPTPAPSVSFTDVKDGDYFAEPVRWAVAQGITKGTSATTFSPERSCTLSQILTFILRSLGEDGAAPADFGPQGSYDGLVAELAEVFGFPSSDPEQPCTRIMAVTLLHEFLGGGGSADISAFTDVPTDHPYYAEAVSWALDAGVTKGTSATTFSPNTVCTRGQIVTFLYRALEG